MFGFMNKKNRYYKLNVCGLEYYKSTIMNGKKVFIKDKMDTFYELYLDKVEGNQYIDIVSGRVLKITYVDNNLVITPCVLGADLNNLYGTKLSLSALYQDGSAFKIASEIIGTDIEKEYTTISEDIIFNNYFCNFVAETDNIDVIPKKELYNVKIVISKDSKKGNNSKALVRKK